MTTTSYGRLTKPDPRQARRRFTATHPKRWFAHPLVAVIPLGATSVAWLLSSPDGMVRPSAPFLFLASAVWLVALPLTRMTLMGDARNFLAFYPDYLAWFRGEHTLLIRRGNIESFTRVPAREPLYGVLGWLNDEPVGEHITLHLYERGCLGYNHLGQTNADLRKHIPIEVHEPEAFEAALRSWQPNPFVATN